MVRKRRGIKMEGKIEESRTVKRRKQMKERNVRQNEKELIDSNKE
jgi:hypothetical protein